LRPDRCARAIQK